MNTVISLAGIHQPFSVSLLKPRQNKLSNPYLEAYLDSCQTSKMECKNSHWKKTFVKHSVLEV